MDLKVTDTLVFDSERRIDVEKSVDKYRAVITAARDKQVNDAEVIAEATNAIYDQWKGAYIQIDALKSFVLQRLNVHPNAYGELGDRVHAYINENLELGNGITKEGKPALFTLKKGKGGGFARRADLAPGTPPKSS